MRLIKLLLIVTTALVLWPNMAEAHPITRKVSPADGTCFQHAQIRSMSDSRKSISSSSSCSLMRKGHLLTSGFGQGPLRIGSIVFSCLVYRQANIRLVIW